MEISITWNICRVCLAEEKKTQTSAVVVEPMRSIFDEDKILAQQIFDCSGIMMEPNDNLPEKICKKCYTLIKHAANFRNTCRASDTYLQHILQRTKSASALFKKQPPLQDPLEDITDNDYLNSDINEKDNKARKKYKDSDCSDLIELEKDDVSDDDSEDSLAQNDILEYSDSCIDEVMNNIKHDENEEDQSVLRLTTSPKLEHQLNEEEEKETEFIEEHQVSETEDLNKNKDYSSLGNSDQEDEENLEKFEHIQELAEHIEITQRDITPDIETANEARVSSTVAIKEIRNNITEFKMEDSNLSTETNDMQTEYIVDEYLIDNSSRDNISLNSSVLVVPSKRAKTILTKQRKSTDYSTKATKTKSDFQVWGCDLCGNHFGNRPLLNAHLKVHRQEKNHECEICLKRFITACNLQAHMRTHTGEKPFECKYCGRRFSDRSSNLRHERTHTNERPFMCQECGKSFSLSTTLKKHITVHTGERSFSCDICVKAFKLPHQLKAHKNSTLHKAVEQLTQIDQ